MPYYSSDQTERSQGVLRQLVDVVPEAVLIGGWGTWVRLHGEMSHDIDLIVEHAELATLRSQIGDFSSSTHVGGQKYRGDFNNIHVDLYVPHQSRLGGKLKLRVEDLGRYRESVDGFSVLSVEAHMATKMAALLDRPDTRPGDKDRHELLELIRLYNPNPRVVRACIERATAQTDTELNGLMSKATIHLGEYKPRDTIGGNLTKQDRALIGSFGAGIEYPSDFEVDGAIQVAGVTAVKNGTDFISQYVRQDGTQVRGYRNPKKKR
jgi:hypothetical protein